MGEDTDEAERTVADLRGRSPGEDSEDPYADVDVSTLPDWWQRAIEEFEAFGLRPYRPPRFADGVLKHTVVDGLEADHGVDIDFVGVNPQYEGDWHVRIDGEVVGPIGRHRSPEGYTVFEMDAEAFRERVRSHLDAR